jgi:hypothetical protein
MNSIIKHPVIAPAYILPFALSPLSEALFEKELQLGKYFVALSLAGAAQGIHGKWIWISGG